MKWKLHFWSKRRRAEDSTVWSCEPEADWRTEDTNWANSFEVAAVSGVSTEEERRLPFEMVPSLGRGSFSGSRPPHSVPAQPERQCHFGPDSWPQGNLTGIFCENWRFYNASGFFTKAMSIFMRSRIMKLLESRAQGGNSHMNLEELRVAVTLNSCSR